jgi:hypothetical protein
MADNFFKQFVPKPWEMQWKDGQIQRQPEASVLISRGDPHTQQNQNNDATVKALNVREKTAQIKATELANTEKARKLTVEDGVPVPGNKNLTGPAYAADLAKTDSNLAMQAQQLVEARRAWPSGMSARSPQALALVAAATQMDPTLDATVFKARQGARNSLAYGADAHTRTSLNTVLDHLGSLYQAGQAMNNGKSPDWNALANGVGVHLGHGEPASFDVVAQGVIGELERATRGAAGSESDIARWKATLNRNASPVQMRMAMGQMANLVGSKVNELSDQYNGAMGKYSEPMDLLHPHAKAIFDALKPDETGVFHNVVFPAGLASLPARIRTDGKLPGDGDDNRPGAIAPYYPSGGNGPGSAGGGSSGGPINNPGGSTLPISDGGMPVLSPEQASEIQRLAPGMSAKGMVDWFASKHMPIKQSNADAMAAYYADPKNANAGPPGLAYDDAAYKAKLDAINAPRNGQGTLNDSTLFANGLMGESLPSMAGAAGGVNSLFNGGTYGNGYDASRDAYTRRLEQGRDANGIGGSIAEGGGLALGAGLTGAATGLSGPALVATDMASGGVAGGFAANPGDTMGGFLKGSAASLGGNAAGKALSYPVGAAVRSQLGQKVINAGINTANNLPGISLPSFMPPAALSGGERAVANAVGKDSSVIPYLQNADRLNVPAMGVDGNAQLTAMGAAAVRRSPDVASLAKATMEARNGGQLSRLGQATDRDLGPVTSVNTTSQSLMDSARAKSAPLYADAYAVPGRTSPELESILGTPAAGDALNRARVIAANNRVDPNKLGFGLDAEGNTSLTSVPSSQTIDYTKRGLDDIIESQRNPLTGKLDLDEYGRSVNGVKANLLTEADRLNPAYATARAAYGGDASANSALLNGKGMYGDSADDVRTFMGNQSPGEAPMASLGYRGQMMDTASRKADRANPWLSAYGNDDARSGLQVVHPEGNFDDFGQQFNMERSLADNSNAVLGGSRTANNQIADQQFAPGIFPSMAVDAASHALTGAPPIATTIAVGRKVAGMMGGLGLDKRAVTKADQTGALLFNPDTAGSASALSDLTSRQALLDDYIARQRGQITRTGGMMGSAAVPFFAAGGSN